MTEKIYDSFMNEFYDLIIYSRIPTVLIFVPEFKRKK